MQQQTGVEAAINISVERRSSPEHIYFFPRSLFLLFIPDTRINIRVPPLCRRGWRGGEGEVCVSTIADSTQCVTYITSHRHTDTHTQTQSRTVQIAHRPNDTGRCGRGLRRRRRPLSVPTIFGMPPRVMNNSVCVCVCVCVCNTAAY